MAFIICGDSNVDRYWKSALNDRKELLSSTSLCKVTKLTQLEGALSSVVSENVVLSVLTNIIIDHVSSVEPSCVANLLKSVSSILTTLLDDYILPLCFRLKDSKVFIFFTPILLF
jgi:hypothetical protein